MVVINHFPKSNANGVSFQDQILATTLRATPCAPKTDLCALNYWGFI